MITHNSQRPLRHVVCRVDELGGELRSRRCLPNRPLRAARRNARGAGLDLAHHDPNVACEDESISPALPRHFVRAPRSPLLVDGAPALRRSHEVLTFSAHAETYHDH